MDLARLRLGGRTGWVAAAALVALLAVLAASLGAKSAQASHGCAGGHVVPVGPGQDLDATIANYSTQGPDVFCVEAGTYNVDQQIKLGPGDVIQGPVGGLRQVGPALDPDPVVRIVGQNLTRIIEPSGAGVQLIWLDISGAVAGFGGADSGAGQAVSAGNPTETVVYRSAIHDNASQGIGNFQGLVADSEFYNNGTDSASYGFTAAAVKGSGQYEASRVYVHDNPYNGLWCDNGCYTSEAPLGEGFYVHDSVVVRNGNHGIRYEDAVSSAKALIENNEAHENGYNTDGSGIKVHNGADALIRGNRVGNGVVDGVRYSENQGSGVGFSQSVSRSGGQLANDRAVGNFLQGDEEQGCDEPGVTCSNIP